jgi:mRNA-degrading endonuclease YafQ of YafQ-DinJ toxin-antitoxin module
MEISFHKNFRKKFQKLPPNIKKRFSERLGLFFENKFDESLNNHSVEKAFPSCRSINITGDYRAIFSEGDNLIVFLAIGSHSELYC